MATVLPPVSEADILAQVVAPEEPTLSKGSAQAIVDLKFSDTAVSRMNDLADKNRNDLLDAAGKAELEMYHRVGQFLNLMQAKARLTLVTR